MGVDVLGQQQRGGALASALRTVRLEHEALGTLAAALQGNELGTAFEAAVEAIACRSGRLIVTGMGKSGIVARKIAATMSSTGTPSVFIHPADASHGDLGAITAGDVVLAISWSGETAELADIIGYARRFGNILIVMTACADSSVGAAADLCLSLPLVHEACPNHLAPTSSTTLQVVLGDALAIALLERRGFSRSDFLAFHPGGRLGARLMTVDKLMGVGAAVPAIAIDATIRDAAVEMSRTRYGGTAVVDERGALVGAFTDGDLRRGLAAGTLDDAIARHMSRQPVTVAPATLASEALRIMNDNAISMLLVCDGATLVGAVHLHDLLRNGMV